MKEGSLHTCLMHSFFECIINELFKDVHGFYPTKDKSKSSFSKKERNWIYFGTG